MELCNKVVVGGYPNAGLHCVRPKNHKGDCDWRNAEQLREALETATAAGYARGIGDVAHPREQIADYDARLKLVVATEEQTAKERDEARAKVTELEMLLSGKQVALSDWMRQATEATADNARLLDWIKVWHTISPDHFVQRSFGVDVNQKAGAIVGAPHPGAALLVRLVRWAKTYDGVQGKPPATSFGNWIGSEFIAAEKELRAMVGAHL